MPTERDQTAEHPDNKRTSIVLNNRSRVTNGAAVFPRGLDGRTAEARRFKDVLADLVEHLGGTDWASEPQKHLARRAAALIVSCERAEKSLATGDEFDVAEYTTAANSLRRLLTDLGLERKPRDVTPGLARYLEETAR